MFTIADHQLLATLIVEVDDLEEAISDTNHAIELSLSQPIETSDQERDFIRLVHVKNIYIDAKRAYSKKIKELENKAYKDNYDPYLS